MERWVYIVEEIPHMANQHTHDLVLGNATVEREAESHQHPGQVWRGEHQQAEEAEPRVWIAPRPDIYQSRGERVSKEGHRHEWGEEE